ncbi:MAG: hypothetical protein ACRD0O_00580 [Acidimicrobiia bacterium]
MLFIAPGLLRPGGGGSIFGTGGGPLAAGDASDAVSIPQPPGEDVTFGHVVVSNPGRSVAILEKVSFEPPLPDNLMLLGIQVASDPDRELATVGADIGYPPADSDIGRLIPLEGAKVPSKSTPEGERGAALIMGFRLRDGDLAGFRQVHVEYRVGSRRYKAKLDHAFIVCSTTAYPDGCPDRDQVFPPE